MKTKLSVGDYFRFRYRGQFDYGLVMQYEGEKQYTLLPWTSIPKGATVHNAVWVDGDTLQSRGVFVFRGKRKGDREVL